MTEPEFKGGWKTLRGSGLQGAKEASESVYFEALKGVEAPLWALVVDRAKLECNFFPSVSALVGIIGSVRRQLERDEDLRITRKRRLEPPPPPVHGHPECPMKVGEHWMAYLERLAFHLVELPREGYQPIEAHVMAREPGSDDA